MVGVSIGQPKQAKHYKMVTQPFSVKCTNKLVKTLNPISHGGFEPKKCSSAIFKGGVMK